MAYTQQDLDNVKRAIATGTLRVKFGDQEKTFRSLDELERIQVAIEREINGKPFVRRTTASYESGL